MQIQSGLSLMDYLNDPAKSQEALDRAVQSQKQNLAKDLLEVDNSLDNASDKQMDETLKKMEEGQTTVSLQSLDNMISFHMKPVAEQLQDLAKRFDVNQSVEIKLQDGKWQVEGADAEDAEPGLKRLQQYLDADQGLQKRMDQLNRLSEFYEWGNTREYAAQLKEAKVSQEDVVAFLKTSRTHIMGLDSFSVSSAEVSINSRGEALKLLEAAQKSLGVKLTDS
ncbi:hypothetical protein [Bowmanella denitrificans]|uniref:hypothetical protein n=1 Tax=Bowmanella denitrificans TaxID=366582 RepID=UPI000C9ABB0F|nr:hypothetical protein [Bowmanella denitrificans]